MLYTCEGYSENVAVRGTATQSSMYGYCYGSNAIDGNRNSNFHLGSCSCTAATHNPWWRVDLLQKYNIYKVVITNRGDCCPERINGAEIRIGNFLDNEGNNNPSLELMDITRCQVSSFLMLCQAFTAAAFSYCLFVGLSVFCCSTSFQLRLA
uniref:Fucolectin tachylectin-4 pentraxin-1 domain-containing protein n=1 Tax=Erpetoichthys calabaricus TaxID=27687 RepID=A0A8C4T6F0_ERPCA